MTKKKTDPILAVQNEMEELIEELFPKGVSKERGAATILHTRWLIALQGIVQYYQNKYKDDEIEPGIRIENVDNGFIIYYSDSKTLITTPEWTKDEYSQYKGMDETQRLAAALLYEIYDWFFDSYDKWDNKNLNIQFNREGHKYVNPESTVEEL